MIFQSIWGVNIFNLECIAISFNKWLLLTCSPATLLQQQVFLALEIFPSLMGLKRDLILTLVYSFLIAKDGIAVFC